MDNVTIISIAIRDSASISTHFLQGGQIVNEIVVREVEELKSCNRSNTVSTIIVEGELASNILASGILKPANGGRETYWHVPGIEKHAESSPTYVVARVLHDLTLRSTVTVINGTRGRRIKIYPTSLPRREGN
jgi:hypothetical protein